MWCGLHRKYFFGFFILFLFCLILQQQVNATRRIGHPAGSRRMSHGELHSFLVSFKWTRSHLSVVHYNLVVTPMATNEERCRPAVMRHEFAACGLFLSTHRRRDASSYSAAAAVAAVNFDIPLITAVHPYHVKRPRLLHESLFTKAMVYNAVKWDFTQCKQL